MRAELSKRAWISQWVEPPTEKPGAILTRVRVPGAARDFSPRIHLQYRLSHGVRTALVYTRMHQHVCVRSKSQTLASVPLFGHTDILLNTDGNG